MLSFVFIIDMIIFIESSGLCLGIKVNLIEGGITGIILLEMS